jgi:hypothetical protein
METYINKIKLFTKVYNKFKSIENEKDLKKNKLALVDYEVLFEILKKISNFKECSGVWCMQENVANWCKNQGMYVIPPKGSGQYDSVNYWISIIEN